MMIRYFNHINDEVDSFREKILNPKWCINFENAVYDWIEKNEIPIREKEAQILLRRIYEFGAQTNEKGDCDFTLTEKK